MRLRHYVLLALVFGTIGLFGTLAACSAIWHADGRLAAPDLGDPDIVVEWRER